MKFTKILAGIFAAIMLAACGGGGGSGVPGAPSGGGVPNSPTLTLAIVQGENVVNNITVGGGFRVRATLRDVAGAPISSRLVAFDLAGSPLAVFDRATPTALTNASGIAEIDIFPASLISRGAATLSASSTVSGARVSAQVDFSVTPANLTLSAITVGSSNLSSGGNTNLSVTALIGHSPSARVPVNVTFRVSCGRINNVAATGTGVSVTTDGAGIARADFRAVQTDGSLCSGPVTIDAISAGASNQPSTTVTVAAPTANSMTFVSATPERIFLQGIGAQELSVVRFRVLTDQNTPLSGQTVNFALEVNPGGVTFSPSSAMTGINGEVLVNVRSGSIPGPVRLRAAIDGQPSIFAQSQNLSVASGPPSQRFMSLSVETVNIEGGNRDGAPTVLTVRLADRQGNPVEDGTVVNFTTEAGQVASRCTTTSVGNISSCSVNFISQNPRPANGRVSVLAVAEGTKDYEDINGNNRFDPGIDTLVNIGDAFRDDNESNQFDIGEFVMPRGGTVACPGVGGQVPSRLNTCDVPDLLSSLATTVRQQAVILFSSSTAHIEIIERSTARVSFRLSSLDNQLLPMPAGTVISAEPIGGVCAVVSGPSASPIRNVEPGFNSLADLATTHEVDLDRCLAGNALRINVRTPFGVLSSFRVDLM